MVGVEVTTFGPSHGVRRPREPLAVHVAVGLMCLGAAYALCLAGFLTLLVYAFRNWGSGSVNFYSIFTVFLLLGDVALWTAMAFVAVRLQAAARVAVVVSFALDVPWVFL
ncbi:MAG: hypothetical protein ACRDX8_10365, partial [Acidimicrobiales bacterium]